MGKFVQDFKEFISKGNVIDMAVGVIIGNAFNKIVNSLVNDVVMPLVGLLMGGMDVSEMKIVFNQDAVNEALAKGEEIAENALMYGNFLQAVIDFFIIALTVFVALRVFTKLQSRRKKKEEE